MDFLASPKKSMPGTLYVGAMLGESLRASSSRLPWMDFLASPKKSIQGTLYVGAMLGESLRASSSRLPAMVCSRKPMAYTLYSWRDAGGRECASCPRLLASILLKQNLLPPRFTV
ncbi:hypothetical protein [Paenibacillus hamazuiensis]|uniref:hypothetical protein n=1 Tax=Paenibacillus hamazuiensis TaxID=2936508 RepID=UPI00200F8C41|nr:hypothetical protein [Paenibacillus hamazuiensis]